MTEVLKAEQTAETRAKVDAMLADIETLSGDIQRIERADAMAKEFAGAPVAQPGEEQRSKEEVAAAYRSAWKEFMVRGDINKNQRTAVKGGTSEVALRKLNEIKRQMERAGSVEERDQIAGSQSITYTQGTIGGYFVPAGFVYDVEKATKYFAPLLDGSVLRILETASGQVLPYPTSNDTQQAWTIVGEATQVTPNAYNTPNYPTQGTAPNGFPGDVGLGHVNFQAYKGTTGIIRVSLELLQDSAFDIESFLTEAFAVRLGRGYEYYLTNGSGANQPTGILPAIAASGATPVIATGSSANDGDSGNTGANSIGYGDIVNLIHSVDPTYRRGAKFMLHDTTLRHFKTRLDKFGRPLWVPGVKDGEPDTLCGYGYTINQSFPTIAASAVTLAFGAWNKFIVRKVRDLQVLRLDERFADYGEVGFVAFSRIDSNLVDAGTHPLNVLQQHS
jgi:HK97 family phage major capsid protein